MEPLNYLDFELKIGRVDDQYVAQVIKSPVGEVSNPFTLPFSEDRLENLILKISRLRSQTRRVHTSEMQAARDLGKGLFEAVFNNEVRVCFRNSLQKAQEEGGAGLRLKLRLQDAPELANLPWEYLFDPTYDFFLAQSNQTPIVRYLEFPRVIPPLAIELPLQILVMIASPTDYIGLDVEREKAHLQQALAPLIQNGHVQIDWLEAATMSNLQSQLRRKAYHIFHFIGHGGFNENTQEGVLVLEDDQQRSYWAAAHRLGPFLRDHRSLRLIVLNACEGARNSKTDPFASVATNLVRHGIPAVVAMQFEITDQAAIIFAKEFYTTLAEGWPIDSSISEARKAIYAQPNDIEWGTPVLYLRASNGVLFNLKPNAELPAQPDVTAAPAPPLPLAQTSSEDILPAEPATERAIEEPQVQPGQPQDEPPVAEPQIVEPETIEVEADSEPLSWTLPTHYETYQPQLLHHLQGHKKQVNAVCFSPDGEIIASGAGGFWSFGDEAIRLWQVSDGQYLRQLEGHTETIWAVAFSPDGALLASGSGDTTIRLWEMPGGRLLETLEKYSGSVSSIAFSPNGRLLASGSNDKIIRLWQLPDGQLLETLVGHSSGVTSIAFSPDGRLLASSSEYSGGVRIWQVPDGKPLERETESEEYVTVNSVAFSPDSRLLALGRSDHSVQMWRMPGGKALEALAGHSDEVQCVAFSPDGSLLASGGNDKTVRLWRVADGKCLHTLQEFRKQVSCVAFSPNGTMLAAGSHDRTIRVWQLMET